MFLLFEGDDYYPGGGAQNFKGIFDTLDQAIEAFDYKNDWSHVFDLESLTIVW